MSDNHDGMWFFGKNGKKYDPKTSDNGLLVINHEYVNSQHLNPLGLKLIKNKNSLETIYNTRRLASDVRREVNCHGVSIVEMKRRANGGYTMVKDSPFNRRITSTTESILAGPVAGTDLVKTKFDPTGYKTRGINNNCGAGLSPWGTYLTTEENFVGVFARGKDADKLTIKEDYVRKRYGAPENFSSWAFYWHSPETKDEIFLDEFARWDMTVRGWMRLKIIATHFRLLVILQK